MHDVAIAGAAPQTFDTSFAAPTGAILTVAAGGDLQAALKQAQLGDHRTSRGATVVKGCLASASDVDQFPGDSPRGAGEPRT